MNEPIHEIVFERLAVDGTPAEIAETVLAALSGEADLAAVLDGKPPTLDIEPGAADEPGEHIYLSSVTVAGFRGVGPERTLTLRPGPGLTVVVGRNGSGKSSFAEAIELSLTGDSSRWADRNSVWRTGWRNLHASDECEITTEIRVDGSTATTRIRRSWADVADLGDADVAISGAHGRHSDLSDLGLARALRLYRPFLTASDLSKLLAGTPSDLFDAINAILGLDALTAADRELRAAARPLDGAIKEVGARRTELAARLADVDDDRARRAGAALTARKPDLDLLDVILDEPVDTGPGDAIAACRQLRDFTIPRVDEVAQIVADLRTAAATARHSDDAKSRTSVRVAEMLRLALDHHEDTGDGPCPVCRIGALDSGWRATATTSLDELRITTLAARRAIDQQTAAIRKIRTAIAAVTIPVVEPATAAQMPDIGLALLAEAVDKLRSAPTGDPDALADHLAGAYPEVASAAAGVQAQATAWLEQRDSAWRQIVDDIRLWVAAARRVPDHERITTSIRGARAWLRASGEDLRNERVAPFAEHSQQIWEQLRQDSNIELGRMTLTGANTSRRIVLPVSVDGADSGAALGVMSQGELHALGLATFLPRSCAAESPFRFIVIDDPVQSMDPAKVDGLARVLAELSTSRQIIVFTHDNRLPAAIANLELDAETIEVLRAEQSVVTLRPALDPVSRYLDDADAVAYSTDVPDDVRAPVVAELCRSALEAACHRVVWRRRLARGDRHTGIEEAITATAKSVTKVFALALFDDAGRGSDVLTRLNQRYGSWSADAYQACRRGVHGPYLRDLRQLVRDCRRLTKAMT